MCPRKLTRPIAIGAAAIALAIGGYAIADQSSSDGVSGTANAAALAQPGPNQRVVGQIPQNWHSGSGTVITGAAPNKAKAAALAKYPGGIVNRVLNLSGGSYAVHMIKFGWPHHVFVSQELQGHRRHRVGAPVLVAGGVRPSRLLGLWQEARALTRRPAHGRIGEPTDA
jgi:hypothetical protein